MSRRLSAARPALIGLSGPDGGGKSSQAHDTAAALRAEGILVVQVYAYGCPLCRQAPTGAHKALLHGLGGATSRRRRVHAAVDAADLVLRVTLAALRASWGAARRHQTAVVLTDRSPLDGLVRYSDVGQTLAVYVLHAALRCYRMVAVLDAQAGELERRDGEHSRRQLAWQREAFAVWTSLRNVVLVNGAAPRAHVTAELVGLIRSGAASPGAPPGRQDWASR